MAERRPAVLARITMARLPAEPDAPPLETLRTLLESASRLLGEFADDPLLARLTKVFAQMPAADREPIVAMLEREVQARVTAGTVSGLTGLSLRPNPSARLYTRIPADDPRPNPERAVQQALRATPLPPSAPAPLPR